MLDEQNIQMLTEEIRKMRDEFRVQIYEVKKELAEIKQLIKHPQKLDYMSVRDAAEYLDVSKKHMYRIVEQQTIPSYKSGNAVRLRREDVEKYFYGIRRKSMQEINEEINNS